MEDGKLQSRTLELDKDIHILAKKNITSIQVPSSENHNIFNQEHVHKETSEEVIQEEFGKRNKLYSKSNLKFSQGLSLPSQQLAYKEKANVNALTESEELTKSQRELLTKSSVVPDFISAPPIIRLLKKFDKTRDRKKNIEEQGSLPLVHNIIMRKTKEAILLSDLYHSNRAYVEKKEELEINRCLSRETNEDIFNLSEKQLHKRAAFCFKHAIQSRTLRYSFTSIRIRSLYEFHMKPGWQLFLMFLAWLYLFLIFYEPVHSTDFSITAYSPSYIVMLVLEIFILITLLIELILEIIIKFTDKSLQKGKYSLNQKILSKIIVESGLIIDLCLFYSLYPKGIEYFRFGKLLRPFAIMYFHQYSRRTATSIAKTWKYILDVMLLFFCMTTIFALVAVKMVKQNIKEIQKDPTLNAENDLTTLRAATFSLYFLTSLSNYPSIIVPYMRINYNYFFLFLPYILLTVIVIIPIPVAILFEKYKQNRGKLLLRDKLKEKQALCFAYFFLDSERQGYLKFEQWKKFIKIIFKYKTERERKELEDIFFLFDMTDNDKMDVQAFLAAGELLLSLRDLGYVLTPPIFGWIAIQKFLNEKVKLEAILYSRIFEIFIFCAILISLVLTIIIVISTNDSTANLANIIDYYILCGFTAEIILKIFAIGPIKYFHDPLTILDTFCVIISFFVYAPIIFLRILKYPKITRGLNATTEQPNKDKNRKKCKYNIFVFFITSLLRIKRNLYKIILAFSAVSQFILIIWLLFYIYAVSSIEWFYESEFSSKTSIFEDMFFGGFTTFPRALIALFQILTQNWHEMVFNYAEKSSQYTLVFLFFAFFHFLLVVILINLVIGLIWEVIIMIDTQTITGTITQNKISVENATNKNEETYKDKAKEKISNALHHSNSYTSSLSNCHSSNEIENQDKRNKSYRVQRSFSETLNVGPDREFLISNEHIKVSEPKMVLTDSKLKTKERKFQAQKGATFAVNPIYFLKKGLLKKVGDKALRMEANLLLNLQKDNSLKRISIQDKRYIDGENMESTNMIGRKIISNKPLKEKYEIKKILEQILNNSSINIMRHLRKTLFPRSCISGINLIIEKMHTLLPKGVLFAICQVVEKSIDEVKENHIFFPYYEDQGFGGNPTYIEIPNNILTEIIPNSNFSKLANYFDIPMQAANTQFSTKRKNWNEDPIKLSIYKAFSEISNKLKSGFGYLNKRHFHFNIYLEVIKCYDGGQINGRENNTFSHMLSQEPSLERIINIYNPKRPQNEQGRGESTVKDTLLIWIIPVEKSHNASFKLLFERGKENRLSKIGEKEILAFNEDIKEGGITRYWRKYEQFMTEFYEALDRLGLPDRPPEQESLKGDSIPGTITLEELNLDFPEENIKEQKLLKLKYLG